MEKNFATYTVNSFTEYQNIILSMPAEHFILYRGQPIDKTLLPKIARYQLPDVEQVEREMIADFQRRSLHLMNKHPNNLWDWLALAQHHGMATRLLDWSENPLIALWFSLSQMPDINTEYSVVWGFHVPPQDVVNDFVYRELNRFLGEGSDWRFQFRHGKATLDDVIAAVRAGMPEIPPEGEEALTVSLFRQLVEEDREKAMPMLDSLPEDKKREALFHSTWLSMVNIKPDDFLAYCRSLPEPEADWEKDLRTKGWNWKARGFLMRYGDDYVEWVKEMPEGLDKETAMNSLIWATREQNPEEARKLSEALYPPKSK